MPNAYIVQKLNVASCKDLSNDIIAMCKSWKTKPNGSLLHQLRSFCAYTTPAYCYTVIDDDLVASLLSFVRESSQDNDHERKIVSLILYIIKSILNSASASTVVSPSLLALVLTFYNLLQQETKSNTAIIGSRLCLMWRALGVAAPLCSQEIIFLASATSYYKSLEFPKRQKKMLLGQKKADRDYDSQVQLWCAATSSIRRVTTANVIPIIDADKNLYDQYLLAATSTHIQLSRHALYILLQTVTSNSSVNNIQAHNTLVSMLAASICSALPTRKSTSAAAGSIGIINFQDMLCSSYLIRIIAELLLKDDAVVSHSTKLELLKPITLFMERSKSLKVHSDCIQHIFSKPHMWEIIIDVIEKDQILAGIGFIRSAVQSLSLDIDTTELKNTALPGVLRACHTIGDFIWNNNTDHIRGKYVINMSTIIVEMQILYDNVYKLLNVTINSIIGSRLGNTGVTPRPHLMKSCLIALMWLAPDTMHSASEARARDVWDDLHVIVSQSMMFFDDDITIDLVSNLFNRVRRSLRIPISKWFSSSTATPTSVHGKTLYIYDKVLIDALVSVAERAVTTRASGHVTGLLQEVWCWLGNFTIDRMQVRARAISRASVTDTSSNSLLDDLASLSNTKTAAQLHAQSTLFTSIVRALDTSSVSLHKGALWVLGEYGLVWMLDASAEIKRVVHQLVSSSWLQTESVRGTAISGMVKLLVRVCLYERIADVPAGMTATLLRCKEMISNELERMTDTSTSFGTATDAKSVDYQSLHCSCMDTWYSVYSGNHTPCKWDEQVRKVALKMKESHHMHASIRRALSWLHSGSDAGAGACDERAFSVYSLIHAKQVELEYIDSVVSTAASYDKDGCSSASAYGALGDKSTSSNSRRNDDRSSYEDYFSFGNSNTDFPDSSFASPATMTYLTKAPVKSTELLSPCSDVSDDHEATAATSYHDLINDDVIVTSADKAYTGRRSSQSSVTGAQHNSVVTRKHVDKLQSLQKNLRVSAPEGGHATRLSSAAATRKLKQQSKVQPQPQLQLLEPVSAPDEDPFANVTVWSTVDDTTHQQLQHDSHPQHQEQVCQVDAIGSSIVEDPFADVNVWSAPGSEQHEQGNGLSPNNAGTADPFESVAAASSLSPNTLRQMSREPYLPVVSIDIQDILSPWSPMPETKVQQQLQANPNTESPVPVLQDMWPISTSMSSTSATVSNTATTINSNTIVSSNMYTMDKESLEAGFDFLASLPSSKPPKTNAVSSASASGSKVLMPPPKAVIDLKRKKK